MEHIKVSVVEFSDRKFYMMQFVDPVTGRKRTRSTKVERTGRKRERIEAERVAGKFESELREGRFRESSKLTWAEFRERYDVEKLASLSRHSQQAADTTFNHLERLFNPKLLSSVPQVLGRFQAKLRGEGMAETSIATHLRHLRPALNWAFRQKLLCEKAHVDMPAGARGQTLMRGRPITGEELERMLAETPHKCRKTPHWS